MEKITFKNGEEPYINADNLNQLQNNVENAILDIETLPSGGTKGQVLTKNSASRGDAKWEDIEALPEGGTTGQILSKKSDADGDAEWKTISTNEVTISLTEPAVRTKLWLRKGKNLFNRLLEIGRITNDKWKPINFKL